MTTIITTILFMTAFKKIEGFKFEGNIFWAFILALCSLLFTSVYWAYQVLRLFLLTAFTFGIYLIFAWRRITKLGMGNHVKALLTAPTRFLAEQFSEQLSFDSEKAIEEFSLYIFLLSMVVPCTFG